MPSKYPQYLLSGIIAADGSYTIPPATEAEAGSGRLSIQGGWGTLNQTPLENGGIAPYRSDFNGLAFLLSQFLVWYQQGGVMRYSSSMDYEPNNEVFLNQTKYRCLKANGPSSQAVSPSTQNGGEYWQNLDEGFVLYDKIQSLTEEQKLQARTNIGAIQSSDISGFVSYTVSQNIGSEQKQTARTNIGAAPLDGPVFIGSPKSTTPGASDNSTRIPTTAWVRTYFSNNQPNDYVVQSSRSGSSWWRKWKSGFIEQHGVCGNNGTFNFVTAFTDVNSISLQGTPTSGGHPDDCYCILNPISTSQFTVRAQRFGNVNWYACGW